MTDEFETVDSSTTAYPLTDRDIWVCTALDEQKRKRPRAPYLHGHSFPAEWNSDLPDDERPETDFETVRTVAEHSARELDRQGWKLPADSPEQTLSAGVILPGRERSQSDERPVLIDWDDVRDPDTGAVHPVCAEYLEAYDGYADISRSGTGVHQWVIGNLGSGGKFIADIDTEPFIGDDNPQVELYDCARHAVCTGKHIDGTGEEAIPGQDIINDIGERFAEGADANPEYFRSSDQAAADGGASSAQSGGASASEVFGYDTSEHDDYDGPELAREHVENALDHVDESLHYSKWLSLGFALHDWDSGQTGKEVFESWSQSNPKWTSDGQPHIDDIWQNGSSADERAKSASTGTLVYLARKGGWEPPTMGERAKEQAHDALSDALDAIDAIGGDQHDAEIAMAESSIIEEFASALAAAKVGGFSSTGPMAKHVSKASAGYTKADIETLVSDAVEQEREAERQETDDGDGPTWEQAQQEYGPDDWTDPDIGRQYAADLIQKSDEFRTHDESETVYHYADDRGIFLPNGEHAIRERCENGLDHRSKKSREQNIVNKIENRTFTDADEFGGPSGAVCVANGVLDVATRTMSDHSPDHLFLTDVNVEYDEDADCPNWREFIDEMVPERSQAKIQEYAGYLLMHWGNPFKKALFIYGPQDSGKSTLIKVLTHVLGSDNVSGQPLKSIIDDKWGAAQLFGKYANFKNDIEEDDLESPGRFKALTGNDASFSAQQKHEKLFEFVPSQKHIYAANRYPDVKNADLVFHDRWLHVEFPNSIPKDEQNAALFEILKEEAPGILNWMLEGLKRLVEQGHFTNERTREEKRTQWMGHTDTVNQFIHEHLEITSDDADFAVVDDVYDRYTEYCDALETAPETKTALTQALIEGPGMVTKKSKMVDGDNFYAYFGVKLADE